MTMRPFTRISSMTLAGTLTLAAVGVLGIQAAAQDGDRGKLEGTWLNEVKIVTCPPAPFAVIATFESMTTYMRGGTLVEGGGPPAPAVSRSAGHGIWERS